MDGVFARDDVGDGGPAGLARRGFLVFRHCWEVRDAVRLWVEWISVAAMLMGREEKTYW